MSFKAIFKTLKKRFGKKECDRPSGTFIYNVMMIPEVRKEIELAMELRGRSAASILVDAECAQLREMLGRKVDMVGRKNSETTQSISSESIVAPLDEASSLASIVNANEKDKDAMGPISLSTDLKVSQPRDAPAERDVLCLMNFGHLSNRSAATDTASAVAAMRLNDDVKIAAPSEKAVLAMIGLGANAERVCSPTEKDVLEMMGFPRRPKKDATPRCLISFPRRAKKDATPRCDEEPAKIKEDAQIGAQASVSVGGRSSARVRRLSGGMGGAQALAHPSMACQKPIVERCDTGTSAIIGVGVKTCSSLFIQDLFENVASLSPANLLCEAPSNTDSPRPSAKGTNILRLALRSTDGHKIGARRHSLAAVTRMTGKENMPAHFYQRPRVAPAPPPTMSPFIRTAVQAMKKWDADIAEDSFWAQV